MQVDLTKGAVAKNILIFAVPMICGNLLQQLYNVVDTLIVGKFLGERALAAVGSSYTLLTFLTSVFLGMCMGCGAVFSIRYGEKAWDHLRENIFTSFIMIAVFTVLVNGAVYLLIDRIMYLLNVPEDIYPMMREYLWVIFGGITATFLYNFFASLLRAVGNSVIPLVFLGISAVINIVLDLLFVLYFHWGVWGAAAATVFAQWISGIGSMVYTLLKCPMLRPSRQQMRIRTAGIKELLSASILTCMQQSVMNFGILMVQGLVNSFGSVVMAAFAAATKIDSFAYMPLQDFGNAFSTFVAQNYGAGEEKRIRKGIRVSLTMMLVFSGIVSAIVFIFAEPLLLLFIHREETQILSVGRNYLRIVGVFYFGIGGLFMLYGLYRALNRPGMSLVLTFFSLGTRVALAYLLSAIPSVGVTGIWWAVPIGWLLADFVGVTYYLRRRRTKQSLESRCAGRQGCR